MRQLWLVRHAKSDFGHASLADYDRTLNPQGLSVAKQMGRFLSEQKVSPALMLSSPAKRARQTSELIGQGIGYPVGRIQFEKSIYEASPDTLLDTIGQVPETVQSLMVVGHNPGMTLLVNMLGAALDSMSTCTVVSMGFESPDWDLLCYPPKDFRLWQPAEVLR